MKIKKHIWAKSETTAGRFYCRKCNAKKIIKQRGEFEIIRGDIIDTTTTREHCFKLTKE